MALSGTKQLETFFVTTSSRPSSAFRLWCFPHAGAGASGYYGWGRSPHCQDFEIAALRLPGRETRFAEEPITDFRFLVETLGTEIARYYDLHPLHHQYAFFGHSFGGLLSFEVARWLQAHKKKLPAVIFISGMEPPPDLDYSNLHTIPTDDEFLNAVAFKYNGIPAELLAFPEMKEMIAPPLRGDITMYETYQYREAEPLAIEMIVCGGSEDEGFDQDRGSSWSPHCAKSFSLHMFPGDHFYHLDRSRDLLLEFIALHLRKYLPDSA